MNNRDFKILFLVLLLLAFFGLQILPIKKTIWDYPLFAILVFLVFKNGLDWKSLYGRIILVYSFCVLGSCFYSNYVHHQNLFMVIAHSYKFFALLFYSYLVKQKISASDAEKILINIAIICCVCYIIQWLIYPVIIFTGAETKAHLDGYYRVRIPGSICCFILFFYGINNWIRNRNGKFILYSVLGGIPIIIQGFRSLTTLSLSVSFLMIPFVTRRVGKSLVYTIIATIIMFIAIQTPLVQNKIDEMSTRTQNDQTFSNDDYVRWIELDYFWNEQFKDPIEKIIGGGVQTDPTSKYTQEIWSAYENHIYWDDLGIVGLSMVIGIPAVLLLVFIYCVCMWKCKEPILQYLRFTLFVVLAGSIMTSSELFRDGNILLLSLILYIEYRYHYEHHMAILFRKKAKKLKKHKNP